MALDPEPLDASPNPMARNPFECRARRSGNDFHDGGLHLPSDDSDLGSGDAGNGQQRQDHQRGREPTDRVTRGSLLQDFISATLCLFERQENYGNKGQIRGSAQIALRIRSGQKREWL